MSSPLFPGDPSWTGGSAARSFAGTNTGVLNRSDHARKDRTPAGVGRRFHFFSNMRFALCRRIGPFNLRRSAIMLSVCLVLAERVSKFLRQNEGEEEHRCRS
jgi:hypothetical protein